MNNILIYIIQVSACLALFYSMFSILFKRQTGFTANRIFLLMSIGISFLIPIININLSKPDDTVLTAILHDVIVININTIEQTVIKQFSSFTIISAIYLTGLSIFLLKFILQIIQIMILIKSSQLYKYNNFKIFNINKEISPFSFFNLVFINNSGMHDKDLEKIMAHERIHIKQFHSADMIIIELLIILQWFNPFVWMYKKSISELHEYIADEGVIEQGFNKISYQKLILSQINVGRSIEFANYFSKSLIKRRLIMMTNFKPHKSSKLRFLLVIPAILILAVAFSFTTINSIIPAKQVEITLSNPVNNTILPQDSVYKKVDVPPEFPGGRQAMNKFIVENLKYPEKALKANVSGTVYIQFVVEKDGNLSDIELLRGIGHGCDKEAIRVVKMMPKWKPGKKDSKSVRVKMVMPFAFKLD